MAQINFLLKKRYEVDLAPSIIHLPETNTNRGRSASIFSNSYTVFGSGVFPIVSTNEKKCGDTTQLPLPNSPATSVRLDDWQHHVLYGVLKAKVTRVRDGRVSKEW